jgi:lipopolysaccharide biosynthesis protein
MTDSPSLLKQGNTALREQRYADALDLYAKALQQDVRLAESIRFNMDLARSKLNIESDQQKNQQILLLNTDSELPVEPRQEPAKVEPAKVAEKENGNAPKPKHKELLATFSTRLKESAATSDQPLLQAELYKKAIQELALITASHNILEDAGNLGFLGKPKVRVDDHVHKVISESKLFDSNWYTRTHPDVMLSGVDPVTHYIKYGWQLGRDPSPKFSTTTYFELNNDVHQAEVNPLEHYIFQGLREGRNFKKFLKADELGVLDFTPTRRGDYTYIPKKTVRTICFYLPQFHAIPENDKWWGEGFTEWTNVIPAKPQFDGHYQPHVPHADVGYYNLLEPATLTRQIKQAEDYGIDGFCFYFYWFGGNRLLEKPIEIFQEDKSHSMPFCLCWANENWSRRWDGNESDVLMAQNHSDEDDLNFIKYISKYVEDSRYIKVDGKPLLIVYRPAELPNAKRTANIWREYCRNNGIGEIYLATTNSFEKNSPEEYGFDAVVDFTPNSAGLSPSRELIENLPPSFDGGLFNYENLVAQSDNYAQESFTIFRGASPSWDNTARKKNRGYIFLNSSPTKYQKWLDNSIKYMARQPSPAEDSLVFINAWNEWAEGAHLEPDQKYGYAYLESTKLSILKSALAHTAKITASNKKLAIIIHAFYLDVLEEFLVEIKSNASKLKIKLYVSIPFGNTVEALKILNASGLDYILSEMQNLGRDVLPFIKMARMAAKDDFPIILKLHTKKSKHRDDGDVWRNELVQKLVGGGNLTKNHQKIIKDQSIGLLCPAGHLVPLKNHWGGNAEHCAKLANRLGFDFEEIIDMDFAAGTMFFAQTKAILPLLNLAVDEDDFDEELGQTDGTFAHAVERVFPVSCAAAGLRTVEQSGQNSKKTYSFATIG